MSREAATAPLCSSANFAMGTDYNDFSSGQSCYGLNPATGAGLWVYFVGAVLALLVGIPVLRWVAERRGRRAVQEDQVLAGRAQRGKRCAVARQRQQVIQRRVVPRPEVEEQLPGR